MIHDPAVIFAAFVIFLLTIWVGMIILMVNSAARRQTLSVDGIAASIKDIKDTLAGFRLRHDGLE